MNQLIITGRIGQEPELRYTPSGKAVLNFSVATDVGFGDNKKTQWITIAIWEKRAEGLAPHLAKGDMVSISGQATSRAWINKNSGEAQSTIEMNANQVTLCGGGGGQQGGGQQGGGQQRSQPQGGGQQGGGQRQAAPQQATPQDFGDFDDDIPF